MAFLNLKDINYLEESMLEDIFSKSIITESYFNTSLVTISKLNREYRESLSEFCNKAINESAMDAINSLYKEFMNNVSNIVDKFNKCIKDNHSNYISSLKRKMSQDKISLDRNKITDVRAGNIYNFTISDDVPKVIGSDIYYEEVNKLQKILKNNSMEQDQKAINLLFVYNELMEDLRGSFYNRFRGQILGLKNEVSALEYADTLFAIYRDGGQPINTVIEKDEILEIEKRFKNSRSYITSVEKQKDAIIKEYDRLKREISSIKLSDIANNIGSNAQVLDERLQTYIKAKTEQLLNMCSIHTMAYTAKLDATAALYIQDKAILTAVVNKYTPTEDNEEIEENYSIYNDFYIQSVEEYGNIDKLMIGFKIKNKQSLENILKSHKYEGILNYVQTTKKVEDLEYLKKDYQIAKSTFTKIRDRINLCNKLGECKETKNYYKNIKKKYIDKGITAKDVDLTIKWYQDNYVPTINRRIKELKNK